MEKLIFKKISAAMADLSAIDKNRKNSMQNYKFRGIDDIYNECHHVLSKHEIFTVPRVISSRTEERKTKSGGNLIYRILTIEYKFFASDGSFIECVIEGEGMDSGDKAGNKALSAAHKYALLQVFCIPTIDKKDSENDSPAPISKPSGSINYNSQIVKIMSADSTKAILSQEDIKFYRTTYSKCSCEGEFKDLFNKINSHLEQLRKG